MSSWSMTWLGLIAVGVVIELAALTNKRPDDTLSEHVWRWFAVREKKRRGWVGARRAALLLLMVWLTVHFVTGGRV